MILRFLFSFFSGFFFLTIALYIERTLMPNSGLFAGWMSGIIWMALDSCYQKFSSKD